jgi:hypothetical protein
MLWGGHLLLYAHKEKGEPALLMSAPTWHHVFTQPESCMLQEQVMPTIACCEEGS